MVDVKIIIPHFNVGYSGFSFLFPSLILPHLLKPKNKVLSKNINPTTK